MEPSHLWCYACSRLHRRPRGGQDGNGCARCGNPAAALESVVDVVDSRAFLHSCHPDRTHRTTSHHADDDADPPLPTTTVRDAGRDCAVCMEALAAGSSALVTPCGHAYHARCVAPWLRAKGTCPLCRARVGAADDDDRRDGLVLCRFHSGRLGLGRRVAGRVFNVRVLDADGNLERPRPARGFKTMLLRAAEMTVGAVFRRDRFFRELQHA
ncbi:hypothetical protein PR202_ga09072 [Eleusine coracana subsp. coracana]|uniref:RING-type domain-containing protein n=1 Tax=Eleusine coracana subsp. coracana TaxID=191504 RepID=A0AAV5C2U5_ELECO|nr:hypothetical protein QOZ80_1AG0039620 [Eleusine coracana subsp. coracana]GJM92591.1 hypothetical protein PR202_ga09072 [Eleusine coracana subsp. coracana]